MEIKMKLDELLWKLDRAKLEIQLIKGVIISHKNDLLDMVEELELIVQEVVEMQKDILIQKDILEKGGKNE